MKNDFREYNDDEYILHDAIDGDGFIDGEYLMHWKWQRHKYLYIDKNGNYVYPEDVNKLKSVQPRDPNRGHSVNDNSARRSTDPYTANPGHINKRYLDAMNEANAWNRSLKGKVRNAYEDVKINAKGIANEAKDKIKNLKIRDSKLYKDISRYLLKRKISKKYNSIMQQAEKNRVMAANKYRLDQQRKNEENRAKAQVARYDAQKKASAANQKYYDKGSTVYKNEQRRIQNNTQQNRMNATIAAGRQAMYKEKKRVADQRSASLANQKYYDKGSTAYKNEQRRIQNNTQQNKMNATIAAGRQAAYAKKKADEMFKKALNAKTGKAKRDWYRSQAEMYENMYNPNKRNGKKKRKGKVG